LKGKIGEEVKKTIIIQSERLGCEIVELNIQADHVHSLIKVPLQSIHIIIDGCDEGEISKKGVQY